MILTMPANAVKYWDIYSHIYTKSKPSLYIEHALEGMNYTKENDK